MLERTPNFAKLCQVLAPDARWLEVKCIDETERYIDARPVQKKRVAATDLTNPGYARDQTPGLVRG